jgi:N-methylhydantoinase A
MHVGVDIGGTFTDLAILEDGVLRIHKLLSTPHDPSQAMLAGLRAVTGDDLSRLESVAHGSTVATNAILERKGAKVAFLVTAGFRDLLAIARQDRPDLYALHPTLPPPLIPRERCFEVAERIASSGDVLEPLDLESLDAALEQVRASGSDALAVCLLFSFLNPAHEQAIAERARAILGDDFPVVLSSEVLPEFREYERASTTVMEAYVRPVMARYIGKLARSLPAPLRVMRSDGGVMGAGRVATEAVQTALSGPAAGVIGAVGLAKQRHIANLITLDMGGTSTDVALIPGQPTLRRDASVDGLPLRLPMLDIETVGAGGGSLARVDSGGALRVGPESAGANPGPACYGNGGTQATVTDAHVVLGHIAPEHFLGGTMALDVDAAQHAVTTLAAELHMSMEQTARGILEVANATIERAVRRVSVARGHDPRIFTLASFGGAGGLQACAVAERLGIRRVFVPRYPGVLCALGLLMAQVEVSRSRSVVRQLDADADYPDLAALAASLSQACSDELAAEGVAESARIVSVMADLRYLGQAYELSVPFSAQGTALYETFHAAHAAAYGHALHDRPVELVTLRARAQGLLPTPEFPWQPMTPHTVEGNLVLRDDLKPGAQLEGPCIVAQLDATTLIPAGWRAHVDGYLNLMVEHR